MFQAAIKTKGLRTKPLAVRSLARLHMPEAQLQTGQKSG